MRGGFPAAAAAAACIGSDCDKWGNSHTVVDDEADSEGIVNAVVAAAAAAAAPDSFRTADNHLAE